MYNLRTVSFLFALFFSIVGWASTPENTLMQKGWAALVKDKENEAFNYFWQAHQQAIKENNTADKAESLLYLGICSYGSSLEKGLQFATQSLNEYKKVAKINPEIGKIGRYKCLQLISTIYARQKKYIDAMRLSKEVVAELKNKKDNSGTLGLAYNSLGSLFELKNQKDSSEVFYKLALNEFEYANNIAYLPSSYCKIGTLALQKGQKENSWKYYNKALTLAQTSQNKQAIVNTQIALGQWFLTFENNNVIAEKNFNIAWQLSKSLTDKTFEIKAIEALIEVKNKQGNYFEVAQLQNKVIQIKDAFYSFEREQIVKSLEVQFEVAEKDRKLELVSKENQVSSLTNYLLGTIVLLFTIGFLYFRRIYKRDKLLLSTKEKLVIALEDQKKLKQLQFENDIDHKESQLSAITIQMLQKNEIIEEIKEVIQKKEINSEAQLSKIVKRYATQDSNWNDFDKNFESVNKNFYSKLKQKYPDISANDLKICALIKLNLSIKEMASILNISPDSVKTARHRLRKKLQLTTEENLTDFILSI